MLRSQCKEWSLGQLWEPNFTGDWLPQGLTGTALENSTWFIAFDLVHVGHLVLKLPLKSLLSPSRHTNFSLKNRTRKKGWMGLWWCKKRSWLAFFPPLVGRSFPVWVLLPPFRSQKRLFFTEQQIGTSSRAQGLFVEELWSMPFLWDIVGLGW